MGYLYRPPRPHKCPMPTSWPDIDPRSVWECDECLRVWVSVESHRGGVRWVSESDSAVDQGWLRSVVRKDASG
jgi:hypothetical protein